MAIFIFHFATLADAQTKSFTVDTDNQNIVFSSRGGVPIQWNILIPSDTGNQPERVALIDPNPDHQVKEQYPFHLQLTSDENTNLNNIEYVTHVSKNTDHSVITFRSQVLPSGLQVTKRYRFENVGYEGQFELELTYHPQINPQPEPMNINMAIELGPGLGASYERENVMGEGLYTYVRPLLKTEETLYSNTLSPDLNDEDHTLNLQQPILWAGIHNRYFMMSLAPKDNSKLFINGQAWLMPMSTDSGAVASYNIDYPEVSLGLGQIQLAPDQTYLRVYHLYAGPKVRDHLEKTGIGLTDVLYAGLWNWMRSLCFALAAMLKWFHAILNNWGLSIIALAAAIRLMTYPIAQMGLRQQAKTMADQTRLKPEVEKIKEKYKGDSAMQTKATMQLYKEQGVNPFAAFKGCLWVLLQIPIFVAIFKILGQDYDLRGVGFLWIKDLSQPDHLFKMGFSIPWLGSYFNILPVIMGATQTLVMQFSSNSASDSSDATKQRRMMYGMAVIFMFLFYSFPSGMVIYWTCSNLGQLIQQYMMKVQDRIFPPINNVQ